MKEEEKIIKNTIKRTKEYDRTLSPYACKTSECQKLRKEESEHEEFDIRWPFEEDIDRILYCKSYQRYTDKTQALSFFQSAHTFNPCSMGFTYCQTNRKRFEFKFRFN